MTVGTYRNPLLPGFNPDPSITYVPDKGYFICTSTFEFWPGLPIYHSNDLVNWKLIGHAINRRSQGVDLRTVDPDAGLWAPTIRYHQNRWYVTCVCFGRLDGKVSWNVWQAYTVIVSFELTRPFLERSAHDIRISRFLRLHRRHLPGLCMVRCRVL
jgi:beta-xylosidase